MRLFGRRVLFTTLDPLPRSFRAAPGVLAINHIELEALNRNDGVVFKLLANIVQAEDAADARRTFVHKPRKVTRKTPKLAPSHRMFMLNAIGAGDRVKQ